MLEYAFKKNQENVLIHISEVERGLACNCICPSCKKKLIARKGKKKAHHFSHYKAVDCGYGLQTALHIKAKEIIEKYKIFRIPFFEVKYKNIVESITKERLIKFDSVKLERRQGEIIPDVIGILKGHKIFIEIFVTHKVSDKKKEYIRNEINVSCIEIDLSNLYQNNRNIENRALEEKIIHNIESKKWIHNSLYKSVKEKAKTKWLEIEREQKARRLKNEREQKARRLKNEREQKLENIVITSPRYRPNPTYHVEIDNIIKGNDFPGKYDDTYKGFKIVGRVVGNKEISFEAKCSIRPDGENLLIPSIVGGKDRLYEEINTIEIDFKDAILKALESSSLSIIKQTPS